jgi:hypothetical protein
VIHLTVETAIRGEHTYAMTALRHLSLPGHGAIELVTGMVMLLAPAFLGFSAAGLIVSIVLGASLMGMALTLTARDGSVVGWHRDFDMVFVVVAAVAALWLALAGQSRPALFIAVLVVIQSTLNLATRYVAAG